MWIQIKVAGVTKLLWLVFYLPPGSDQEPEESWHAEIDGLEADLLSIEADFPNAPLVLSGDANVQPHALGGGPDRFPRRDSRLADILSRFNFQLGNPPASGALGNVCPCFSTIERPSCARCPRSHASFASRRV